MLRIFRKEEGGNYIKAWWAHILNAVYTSDLHNSRRILCSWRGGGQQNVQGFAAATLPQHGKKFGTVQLEETAGLGEM